MLPLTDVPERLAFVNKIDPVSHGVAPMRLAVITSMNLPAVLTSQLGLNREIFDTTLSVWAELFIVAVLGVVFVTWAALAFAKQD